MSRFVFVYHIERRHDSKIAAPNNGEGRYMWASVAANPRYVNTVVKQLVKMVVAGMNDNFTGMSLRIGGINTMVAHCEVTMAMAVMKSGHDHRSACAIWEYILCQWHLVAVASRAIMGHRYATAIVQAPALPASYLMTLSAEELNKLNRFIGSLLNLTGSAYNVNVGRLWGWAVVKFSTVIMYLFEFMAAVRENNGIVRTILK